jgi:alpha-tubulin suppressor-like RCC1 family protein
VSPPITNSPTPSGTPLPSASPTPSPTVSPGPTSTPLPTSQSGYLYAWGPNAWGMLGNNTSVDAVSNPVANIISGYVWNKASSGYNTAGSIKNDGTLWMWGSNLNYLIGNGLSSFLSYSSPVQTAVGGNNWIQISVGRIIAAGIKSDTSLWMWGFNQDGNCGQGNDEPEISTPSQIITVKNWLRVSCGDSHTMAIKTDGSLWGWGANLIGQIGLPQLANFSSPVQSAFATTDWYQVACGTNYTLALKKNGTLWAWGYNYLGQLGNNTETSTSTPVQIGSGIWNQIASGYGLSAGILNDGSLYTWGFNGYGSLGDNTIINRSSPVKIGSSNTWLEISCGVSNISARKNDGTIWTTGNAGFGKLGNSSVINQSSFVQTGSNINSWQLVDMFKTGFGIAVATPPPSPSTSVSPTPTPTITLTPPATPAPTPTLGNMKLFTWGFNFIGQLGNNSILVGPGQSVPVQVGTAANWSLICGTNLGFYAIKSDGTMWSWGSNQFGNLGLGNTMNRSVPTQIGTGADWCAVSNTLDTYAMAIKNNGQLYGWGSNTFGAIGSQNTITYSSPVLIAGNTWSSVTMGANATVAIDTSGRLWTCGSGVSGMLGNNSSINRSSFVQTSLGGNNWAKCVAAGNALALKTDGTAWVWGNNYYGNLGLNNRQDKFIPIQIGTESTWSQISCGSQMCGSVKKDGTLWVWGRNNVGQLGDGTVINKSSPIQIGIGTDWMLVQCGYKDCFAVKKNGTLWGWGSNNGGALGNSSIINTSSPIQIGIITTYVNVMSTYGTTAALRT